MVQTEGSSVERMRLWVLLALVLAMSAASCSDDAKPVAKSETCDAVRRHYRAQNVDDQERQRRLEDRIVAAARSERPSQYVVDLADRFDVAIREFRTTGARLTDDRWWFLVQEYQNMVDALHASCEVPIGTPAMNTGPIGTEPTPGTAGPLPSK